MSTKLGLLDLPGELLMRILELHYENVKVKINPFSRRLLYWDAEFLWPRMSCKLLGELAETSFFENAEVYIDTEDMVSFKDFFESSPFDESTKHPIVSRHTTRDHSILYPVQLFRHLSLGRLSFTNYLSKASDQAQKMPKSILETFPFLQSLLAECTIWLPRQQTDSKCVQRLFEIMSECATGQITLCANITFERRTTTDYHAYNTNTFQCVLNEDMILPYKARIFQQNFYDQIRYLLDSVFGCELDPWTENLEEDEAAEYEYEGVEWVECSP